GNGESDAFGPALDGIVCAPDRLFDVFDKNVLTDFKSAAGQRSCCAFKLVAMIEWLDFDVLGALPDQSFVVVGAFEFVLDLLFPLFARNGRKLRKKRIVVFHGLSVIRQR